MPFLATAFVLDVLQNSMYYTRNQLYPRYPRSADNLLSHFEGAGYLPCDGEHRYLDRNTFTCVYVHR